MSNWTLRVTATGLLLLSPVAWAGGKPQVWVAKAQGNLTVLMDHATLRTAPNEHARAIAKVGYGAKLRVVQFAVDQISDVFWYQTQARTRGAKVAWVRAEQVLPDKVTVSAVFPYQRETDTRELYSQSYPSPTRSSRAVINPVGVTGGAANLYLTYGEGCGTFDVWLFPSKRKGPPVRVVKREWIDPIPERGPHPSMRWSHDGRWLAVLDSVVRWDGRGLRKILPGGFVYPVWHKDNRRILYRGPVDQKRDDVWVFSRDGRVHKRVISLPGKVFLDEEEWSVDTDPVQFDPSHRTFAAHFERVEKQPNQGWVTWQLRVTLAGRVLSKRLVWREAQ